MLSLMSAKMADPSDHRQGCHTVSEFLASPSPSNSKQDSAMSAQSSSSATYQGARRWINDYPVPDGPAKEVEFLDESDSGDHLGSYNCIKLDQKDNTTANSHLVEEAVDTSDPLSSYTPVGPELGGGTENVGHLAEIAAYTASQLGSYTAAVPVLDDKYAESGENPADGFEEAINTSANSTGGFDSYTATAPLCAGDSTEYTSSSNCIELAPIFDGSSSNSSVSNPSATSLDLHPCTATFRDAPLHDQNVVASDAKENSCSPVHQNQSPSKSSVDESTLDYTTAQHVDHDNIAAKLDSSRTVDNYDVNYDDNYSGSSSGYADVKFLTANTDSLFDTPPMPVEYTAEDGT